MSLSDAVSKLLHPAFGKEAIRSGVSGKMGMLSKRGTELCVICNEDTGLDPCIPAWLRVNYHEGQGQLCVKCAREIDPQETVSPPEEMP